MRPAETTVEITLLRRNGRWLLIAVCIVLAAAVSAQDDNAAVTAAAAAAAEEQPAVPELSPADADVEEARRLRELLQRFHRGDDGGSVPAESMLGTREDAPAPANGILQAQLGQPYGPRKVLLRDDEILRAVGEFQQRLDDVNVDERRHNTPVICAVQTRLRGTLVASSTHSMGHRGKHHFLTTVNLSAGKSSLAIADKRWSIELPAESDGTAYLLTLWAPPIGAWELHALPLDAVTALRDQLPAWLTAQLADSAANP